MNAEQKRAWFVLGVFGVCCIAYVVWGLILGFQGAWGAFGLFILTGFTCIFRQREKPDERDSMIQNRASMFAGLSSVCVFVFGCMGIWFVNFAVYQQEQVSIQLFARITLLGGIVFFLTHSLSILILYGRHAEHAEADDA